MKTKEKIQNIINEIDHVIIKCPGCENLVDIRTTIFVKRIRFDSCINEIIYYKEVSCCPLCSELNKSIII